MASSQPSRETAPHPPVRLLRSLTFRLALLYTGLSLGILVMLLGFIYWATAGYMDRQIDATIEEEIRGLAEQYQRNGLNGLSTSIHQRVRDNPGLAAIYLLADARFDPLVGNLDHWPVSPIDAAGWTRFPIHPLRGPDSTARARVFLLTGDLHLLVGRNVRELEATRRLLLDALAWGLAITLALTLGAGLLLSSRVLGRIETINQTSREIMEGDLSRRIPNFGSGDDFDDLADNLNRMLDRIEALMASVRQVSDNIAHDLRTPLTRLRTRLEQARAGDRREIDRAIDDTEELLATFNALLRIARIEAGSVASEFDELDLARLAGDIAELYEPVAADKQQALELNAAPGQTVRGDHDLLFQALANLVDNAIKHSPPGSLVTLATLPPPLLGIAVCDSGPGIPPALHDKVFQRFFRCDASRSTPGSGLGLSLVRAVADIHQARIELNDNQPGLCVRLILGTTGAR